MTEESLTVPALTVDQWVQLLQLGQGFDWAGAVAAFESGTVASKIEDGTVLLDDAMFALGMFFPPAAVTAEYLELLTKLEPVIFAAFAWLFAHEKKCSH